MKPSPPSVPAATPVPWHCLGHLSPSRVPRPPLAWGPCSWEGYESRAHHTLRCDLHLAGTGSGSPSFTAGEAEGIELGSPLGLLCTTVTEVPEQIMCWRKCVCLWHYHPSVPYAGAICPDWEQEPARKSENLTVVRVQASGKYIIPGHGNAANPFNQTQQVVQLNNYFWVQESLLQTLFIPISPLFRPWNLLALSLVAPLSPQQSALSAQAPAAICSHLHGTESALWLYSNSNASGKVWLIWEVHM